MTIYRHITEENGQEVCIDFFEGAGIKPLSFDYVALLPDTFYFERIYKQAYDTIPLGIPSARTLKVVFNMDRIHNDIPEFGDILLSNGEYHTENVFQQEVFCNTGVRVNVGGSLEFLGIIRQVPKRKHTDEKNGYFLEFEFVDITKIALEQVKLLHLVNADGISLDGLEYVQENGVILDLVARQGTGGVWSTTAVHSFWFGKLASGHTARFYKLQDILHKYDQMTHRIFDKLNPYLDTNYTPPNFHNFIWLQQRNYLDELQFIAPVGRYARYSNALLTDSIYVGNGQTHNAHICAFYVNENNQCVGGYFDEREKDNGIIKYGNLYNFYSALSKGWALRCALNSNGLTVINWYYKPSELPAAIFLNSSNIISRTYESGAGIRATEVNTIGQGDNIRVEREGSLNDQDYTCEIPLHNRVKFNYDEYYAPLEDSYTPHEYHLNYIPINALYMLRDTTETHNGFGVNKKYDDALPFSTFTLPKMSLCRDNVIIAYQREGSIKVGFPTRSDYIYGASNYNDDNRDILPEIAANTADYGGIAGGVCRFVNSLFGNENVVSADIECDLIAFNRVEQLRDWTDFPVIANVIESEINTREQTAKYKLLLT